MDSLKTVIKYLPYEVILLNLMRQIKDEELREFILETGNYSVPMGYINSIIHLFDDNILHLFSIDGELYINYNFIKYVIENDKIIPEIYEIIENLIPEDFADLFKKFINNTIFKYIIIQDEKANKRETNLMKYLFDEYKEVFNIKKYTNIDLLNLYILDIVVLSDCVYFIHNNEKFVYKNQTVEAFEWTNANIKNPLMSIYVLKQ
jgi:hypothetical protein